MSIYSLHSYTTKNTWYIVFTCLFFFLFYFVSVLCYLSTVVCNCLYLYNALTTFLYKCLTTFLYTCLTTFLYKCLTTFLYTCLTTFLYTCLTTILYTCLTTFLYKPFTLILIQNSNLMYETSLLIFVFHFV